MTRMLAIRTAAKQALWQVVPPIVCGWWRRLRASCSSRSTVVSPTLEEWECVPDGFERTVAQGWDEESVSRAYEKKWPIFQRLVSGTGPLGVAHESDLSSARDVFVHNQVMTFAYVLALASHGKSKVSLLDWGGGLGHYLLFAKALYPDLLLDYHCKDLSKICETGRRFHSIQEFHDDETCLTRRYDAVMASTSLHYEKEWKTLVAKLARASERYLYITGLPIVNEAPSFVFIQRPYRYGYETEYAGWCLNRHEFLGQVEAEGLTLVREFVVGYRPEINFAIEQNEYCGFLFVRNTLLPENE